jgi:hydrogenase maturation protein HypF
MFVGSICEGFERVAHLRPAALAGGDAAAHHPVQAAAGFLAQVDGLPNMTADPFAFAGRYADARGLVCKGVRTFTTTSMGRLFDAAAALLGFTREVTFEGQAAIWLEQLARGGTTSKPYPFPFLDYELDFRPLLRRLAWDRFRGRDSREIARAFQRGVARGLCDSVTTLCQTSKTDTIVLSGGVFQNELLLQDLKSMLAGMPLHVWTNRAVPAGDGGISLGQTALASFGRFDSID